MSTPLPFEFLVGCHCIGIPPCTKSSRTTIIRTFDTEISFNDHNKKHKHYDIYFNPNTMIKLPANFIVFSDPNGDHDQWIIRRVTPQNLEAAQNGTVDQLYQDSESDISGVNYSIADISLNESTTSIRDMIMETVDTKEIVDEPNTAKSKTTKTTKTKTTKTKTTNTKEADKFEKMD